MATLTPSQIVFNDAIGALTRANALKANVGKTVTLSGEAGTLRENCVQTWLYVKGIDAFYQDMADSRRNLFQHHGMNKDTHFIASIGIEGACAHRSDLVTMDAYSVIGLAPEQVYYLNDFVNLCPTMDYNVTFERGTRVAYCDRAHSFISGTASIDNAGQVVHQGDVMAQLERTRSKILTGCCSRGRQGLPI